MSTFLIIYSLWIYRHIHSEWFVQRIQYKDIARIEMSDTFLLFSQNESLATLNDTSLFSDT